MFCSSYRVNEPCIRKDFVAFSPPALSCKRSLRLGYVCAFRAEKEEKNDDSRSEQDSNLCGQSPIDF